MGIAHVRTPRILLAMSLLAATASRGAEVSDTLHCNARVVVRDLETGKPIARAYVSVEPIPLDGAPAGATQHSVSDDEGIAEFVALPAFRYELYVDGIRARRELPGWRPPRGRRTEVQVGSDPWRPPEEVQVFSERREWTVRSGDCADSIVVRIGPVAWTRQEPERRLKLRPNPTLVSSGVQGKVVIQAFEKETGRPVAYGNVAVVGERRGGMTDEKGSATITLEPGMKRLKFTAPGRLSKTDSVRVRAGRTATLRVLLERNPVQNQ